MLDGIVYKLFSKNLDNTEFYIGSTIDFHQRQLSHKSCCNNVKSRGYNLSVYKYIRDNGGFDEWNFEILELGEYENKKLLYDRERFFITTLNPSLNGNIPNRTEKEYYQDNKEIICKTTKEYYQKNKEIINNRAKEHYQDNKEKINERHREYYQKNKEGTNEYYQKKKEKRKEKIECEVCNCKITNGSKLRHNKSQKHIRNLNNTG